MKIMNSIKLRAFLLCLPFALSSLNSNATPSDEITAEEQMNALSTNLSEGLSSYARGGGGGGGHSSFGGQQGGHGGHEGHGFGGHGFRGRGFGGGNWGGYGYGYGNGGYYGGYYGGDDCLANPYLPQCQQYLQY